MTSHLSQATGMDTGSSTDKSYVASISEFSQQLWDSSTVQIDALHGCGNLNSSSDLVYMPQIFSSSFILYLIPWKQGKNFKASEGTQFTERETVGLRVIKQLSLDYKSSDN